MDELFKQAQASAGEGRYAVTALGTLTARSLLVQVYAGSAHVGSVVWAVPRPCTKHGTTGCTASVLNAPGHKDEAVARPMAEKLCAATGLPVIVAAGLHVDAAAQEDIAALCTNAEAAGESLLHTLFH